MPSSQIVGCPISRAFLVREVGISSKLCQNLFRVVGVLAVAMLAIAAKPAPKQSATLPKERYLSPIEMAFSPDDHLLYVVCQDSDEVRVVDPQSGKVVSTIKVGHVPRGMAISRDGNRLYVTNAWSDTVSVIDTAARTVIQTLPTGFEPSGVAVDHAGTALYVANRLSADVS